MEDQTDEDFFDKLIVDDDDVYKPTASLNLVDGSDSNDVKAFANLSITDNAGNGIESSEKLVKEDVSYEGVEDLKEEVVGLSVKQVGSLLVTSNSLAFHGVIESDSGFARVNGTVEVKESEKVGLGANGIKEVQWSAFSADFAQNDGNGFELFPDFFAEIGDSTDELVGKRDGLVSESKVLSGSQIANSAFVENSNGYTQFQEDQQLYVTTTEQSTDVQDVSSSRHRENLYPGWNYDANTGQFCQVEGCYDAMANVHGGLDSNDLSVTNEKAGVSYLQQTAQPALEAIAEGATTESVTSLKPISRASDTNESISIQIHPSKENNGYPSHMFFDRQYPGWFYDMIAQEWCTLDTYNFESTVQDRGQRYCQAISKSLKTGSVPEVETWRELVSSLEERIKTHQQGGFSSNLAPGKLVGKLLNLFYSTANKVVGSLPPPAPSTSVPNVHTKEHLHNQSSRVSTSQSTQEMSSLIPSASMEHISEWATDTNKRLMQNRSVSEPDFDRTPRQSQIDSSKDASASVDLQKKSSGGFSRFGFGSQIIQKTVGLVLKPRQDKQAKLGEPNKFYFDEKLKRWVEEGVEPPAEQATLPPPPTMATFQNGSSYYNLNNTLKSEKSQSNGSPEFISPTTMCQNSLPPIQATSNHCSVRGKVGFQRYVDALNKDGESQANLFQSPAAPSIKLETSVNPNFYNPVTVPSLEQSADTSTGYIQQLNKNPSCLTSNNSFHLSPQPYQQPLQTMQRYSSVDNILQRGKAANMNINSGSLSSQSRKTHSCGNLSESASHLSKS